MKVLHALHGYFPESTGGSEAYVRDLLAEQQRQGLDVVLLTGSLALWEACGLEELEIGGARVLRVHRDDYYFDHHAKAYHPGVERLVREVLARERPDLLHVHQWIRLTCNLVEIAEELGVPAVVTLHDLYTSCPRAFRVRADDQPCSRPLSVASCLACVPRYGHESDAEVAEGIALHAAQYASELSRARAVLVGSPATADMIAATTGCGRERFTVLPLGYRRRFAGDGAGGGGGSSGRAAPAPVPTPAPLPAQGEPFRFGYWGNLTRRKGAQVLLDAFARLLEAGAPRPVELHLYGAFDTAELEAELRGRAASLPVRFFGRYECAQLRGAALHMAVFPMVCFETFGFVLDEAFELGLPCILTGHGAMPVRAGAAALVVPPHDAPALAEAMRAVLARPALRDELSARIPGLPPTPAEHAAALREVYGAAVVAPPLGGAPPVEPQRRAAFLVAQRESALRAVWGSRGPR